MKLQAPYSKGIVDAQGELAERLMAKGYKKVDEPKPQRKRPAKAKE